MTKAINRVDPHVDSAARVRTPQRASDGPVAGGGTQLAG